MSLNLDPREKVALGLGIVALSLVAVLAAYVPLGPRKAHLASQETLKSLQDELTLQSLFREEEAVRLEKQKALMERIQARPDDFSLFTYMDNLLTATGLRSKAQLEQFKPRNASPRQPMVQLRLQGIALEEFTNLLHKVYVDNNLVTVYKLDFLRPAAGDRGLDCDITFATITLPDASN